MKISRERLTGYDVMVVYWKPLRGKLGRAYRLGVRDDMVFDGIVIFNRRICLYRRGGRLGVTFGRLRPIGVLDGKATT